MTHNVWFLNIMTHNVLLLNIMTHNVRFAGGCVDTVFSKFPLITFSGVENCVFFLNKENSLR